VTISESTLDLLRKLSPHFAGSAGDWAANQGKIAYSTRAQAIELAVALSRDTPGNIVELGTWKGYSTRVIRDELWRARLWHPGTPRKRIFACDSFAGLAEDYEHLKAGTFATAVPKLFGVRIVNGFFEDTLTPELAAEVGPVSFVHLDADLYSSTVTALKWLTPLVQPGTMLLFDEFMGEDPAEARALAEWQEESGTKLAFIALFGRAPSGKGGMSDRRALFQVVGDRKVRTPPPLFPTRLRRRVSAKW
jgi:predicted O-methyltransferase YrrM